MLHCFSGMLKPEIYFLKMDIFITHTSGEKNELNFTLKVLSNLTKQVSL